MTITGLMSFLEARPDYVIISWVGFLVITLLFSMRWPSDE